LPPDTNYDGNKTQDDTDYCSQSRISWKLPERRWSRPAPAVEMRVVHTQSDEQRAE